MLAADFHPVDLIGHFLAQPLLEGIRPEAAAVGRGRELDLLLVAVHLVADIIDGTRQLH